MHIKEQRDTERTYYSGKLQHHTTDHATADPTNHAGKEYLRKKNSHLNLINRRTLELEITCEKIIVTY